MRGIILYNLELNFDVPIGNNLKLIAVNGPTLARDISGVSTPYPIGGLGSVTNGYLDGTLYATYYYYFYNWNFSSICQSPREPVVAGVSCVAPCPVPTVDITGLSSFCAGESSLLTADINEDGAVIASYEWFLNGNSVATGGSSYSASQPGDYSLTITTNTGCSYSSQTDFELTQTPSPTVQISGNLSYCQGLNTDLTATASTPSGTITFYEWQFNSNPIGTNNEVLTASSPGNYNVTVTNSFNCSVSESVTIVENTPIIPTITPTSLVICDGEAVSLVSSDAVSYTWSNGENTKEITVSVADDYFVTTVDQNGCEGTSLVVSLTQNGVITPPVVSADANGFCPGENVT